MKFGSDSVWFDSSRFVTLLSRVSAWFDSLRFDFCGWGVIIITLITIVIIIIVILIIL